jgi:hypothetical protein
MSTGHLKESVPSPMPDAQDGLHEIRLTSPLVPYDWLATVTTVLTLLSSAAAEITDCAAGDQPIT